MNSYRNVLNKIARLSKVNHYKDILEYNKNKQTLGRYQRDYKQQKIKKHPTNWQHKQ